MSTPLVTNKMRIQRALIDSAASFDQFYIVNYSQGNPAIAEGSPVIKDSSNTIHPTNARCNEISSKFGPDATYGRDQIAKRTTWNFMLLLEFPCEVTLEFFEQSFLDKIIHLPRDVTDPNNKMPDTSIQLVGTQVQHPAQQDSSTGTKAALAFSITLGRL